MEQNVNGSGDSTRLDRIERIIEVLATTQMDMQQDLKIVLRAQVVMTDLLEKLTAKVGTLAEQMEQLAEAQKHTDQRMDALIVTVDEIIRKRQ
jgi:leucyl aminopeptidase (aminopeptidase T)